MSTSKSQSSSSSPRDDWTSVVDPSERRKIQNRIAQRKFREKLREQRKLDEQREENERRAGAAYTPPNPDELDNGYVSGPPWGSISLKHIIRTGRQREQNMSGQFGTTLVPGAGGSARPGLHLIDKYARGTPAWNMWRVPRIVVESLPSIDTDTTAGQLVGRLLMQLLLECQQARSNVGGLP